MSDLSALVASRDGNDVLRRYALDALASLRAAYARDAQPYIDILVRLKALEPPQPIIFDPNTMRMPTDG